MAVRYKYQVIQALDDKIGRDLRGLVECYLGPNSEQRRENYTAVCHTIKRLIVIRDDGTSTWIFSSTPTSVSFLRTPCWPDFDSILWSPITRL